MSAAIVSSFHNEYRDLYKGLQSHRAANDLRQQVNAAFERHLNYAAAAATASPLFNIPVQSQTSSSTSVLSNLTSSLAAVKPSLKQHAPLTSSNSVANCSASHIKADAPASSKEHRKLDRSVSEPADRSQIRPAPPNSSRYKTELCRPFEENGTCKYGDKCQFAHGNHELRTLTRHPKYKTELCRTFHTTGICPYGPRCHFIHNSEDKKCLFPTLQTSSISNRNACPPKRTSPPPTVGNLDFTFSLGSAGELSPPMSSNSSGSPTSIGVGFFYDIPQSAPPIVNSGFYYETDYNPALSPLSNLVSTPDFVPAPPSHQQVIETTEDSVMNILASELDNVSCLDRGDGPKADATTSKTEQNSNVDANRNLRLPIFSKLAHGSSAQ